MHKLIKSICKKLITSVNTMGEKCTLHNKPIFMYVFLLIQIIIFQMIIFKKISSIIIIMNNDNT